MTVERRAEEPKNGAREGTGDRRKKRARITGATTTVANLGAQWTKRCSRNEATVAGRCRHSANLLKESHVRDADGSCGSRRELPRGSGSGNTQSGSSGPGSDDYGATGTTSSSELVDTQRQTAEGELRTNACEAGRDTQAERGDADARNPNGTGSVHPATAAAGADADFRTAIQ